ncbi:MAG: hypothetical protein WCE75_03690 [Terracidiphilus sp.]
MMHLALSLANPADMANQGLWIFLSIGAVSLFVVFIPLVSWIDSRRREREAFYKAETVRRLAESSGEGAKAAMDLMREENRLQRIKTLEGMKVGGLITLAVGISLSLLIGLGNGDREGWFVGMIPGLIGVAMLVYVYFLAGPIEPGAGK